MQKVRVAVLRGGKSEEYDVSLRTGEGMLGALDLNRYEPVDIVVSRSGEWLVRGRVRQPREILDHIDVALLGFHGSYGEDGTVQRLLESAGVPYTGSGPFASALALNKVVTKDYLRRSGMQIRMARHMVVSQDAKQNIQNVVASITELFGPRYIVKPLASGSSLGTAYAENPLALERVLQTALSVYESVIVEEYIEGKEATCGVINRFRGQDVYILPPIEIARSSPVWGYEAKYDGSVEEICPGRFSHSEKAELMTASAAIHNALSLRHYSRADFIVAKDGIYFLEVNTLPGLTATSLLPKALAAVGCGYEEFIGHLLTQAMEKR